MSEQQAVVSVIPAEKKASVWTAWAVVCVVWGGTFVGTSVGVHSFPPLPMGSMRYLLAAALATVVSLCTRSWAGHTARQIGNSFFTGAMMYGCGNGLVCLAQQTVDAGVTSIAYAFSPILVALFDSLLPRGNKLGRLGWLGLVVSLGGLFYLWLPELLTASGKLQGYLILLLSIVIWAVGILYGKYHSRCERVWADLSLQCLGGGLVQGALGLGLGMWAGWQHNLTGWLALLYLVLIGTIVGNSCFNYGLKYMAPAKMATYSYVNPLTAMFFAWLILGDAVTPRMAFSTVIILAGVFLVQRSTVKSKAMIAVEAAEQGGKN